MRRKRKTPASMMAGGLTAGTAQERGHNGKVFVRKTLLSLEAAFDDAIEKMLWRWEGPGRHMM